MSTWIVMKRAGVIVLFGFAMSVSLIMAGCAKTPNSELKSTSQLRYDGSAFSLVEVPSPADIFALNEQQKEHFLSYYHNAEQQDVAGHMRLFNYLESILQGFDFKGHTYAAEQALLQQSGNCLSLAIVTAALARLVDIDVDYQRVNVAPVFRRYNGILMLSSHVRSHVYEPNYSARQGAMVLAKPKIVIDYFPQSGNVAGVKVSDDDFVAMFYQNLAAEALIRQQYDLAFSLLQQGLLVAPNNAESLNMLAVLFAQHGDDSQAELIYQFTLAHTNFSTNSVSNYVILLNRQGRAKQAAQVAQQYALATDDNPYRWLDVAERAFANDQLALSLRSYQRAIELAPYLHEGYFGLAKNYYQLGQLQKANEAMQLAHQYAYTSEEQQTYQAKILLLEQAIK
ncbi:hypothetical protein IC617_17460 [Neiella sp. HB171785]|uniref:Tetratricopeptide repeat protein n=1 Tax=Neiella litorisoli TaxID=2771431 RepID=A0A8J6UQG2_9GAMM|nr:hypothetical protein [Neiella litorisoli]MBD1391217.1 hypothetical protein [Neiella litorisoli]